jgi:nickel-dependent lactate racemase
MQDLAQNIAIIDTDSAPRIIHFGEDLWLERLPVGTRVIYPPPPLEELGDADAAIRGALDHPLGTDPLRALLAPGMKVTIAVDDISLPLPPMKTPDLRERVLRIVLSMLAERGVDDIHIIVARGLHRRMTRGEIRRMVGSKVFRSFSRDRLYDHDGEDPDGFVRLGSTPNGHPVDLNRRAVESDLVIYVNINLVPMNGGYKSLGVGLTTYETLRAHHTPQVLGETESYMEPTRSRLHDGIDAVGRVVHEHVDAFHVEMVINNRMFPSALGFLAKSEDDFTEGDWRRLNAMRSTLERLPRTVKRRVLQAIRSPYELVAVHAGATEPVHERTLQMSFHQYNVPVEGQADVVITGIPYVSPYSVNSTLNPLLVQLLGLGYYHNMTRGVPVLKQGGTLILCHPCYDRFNREHHPSYVEFVHRLLPETRDGVQLFEKYEREFAENPAYRERYRFGYAYHGAHPFYMWYWGEAGRKHCGRVIAAGATDPGITDLLGWERAESLEAAIAMARSTAPPSPAITLLHHPPIFISDVR